MTITEQPYLETFGCRLETEDGHDHEGDCDWGWSCATCGRDLIGEPCPDHAPMDIPGLILTECQATPRHISWVHANDGYGAPCMWCAYALLTKAHSGCEHSRHRAWRRWKLTHKALHLGWGLGIAIPVSVAWGGGCDGCVTGIRWGRTNEVLFRRREWWSCLLRRHHLFVPVDCADWICGRCSPDPDEASA